MASTALSTLEGILSSSELERARRFRFDQHRNRFIAGRGLMRTLLSRYLETKPAKLEFVYNPYGKPFLSGAFAESRLNFNLAHSENLAIFAVTRAGTIGVDVERIRPLTDADQLAVSSFSARESAAFHNLPLEQKPVAFFNLWTRKEAWLKATGEGIGHLLNVIEVSFLPGEPARFLSLPGDPQTTASWILHDLKPAPGFVAALAIPAQATPLRCCCWDEAATKKTLQQCITVMPRKIRGKPQQKNGWN
jgi:4'-phosphopantetheinyl transferase